MKKYIVIAIITALFFSGCVKDEQPTPVPPPPVDYSGIVINELITKDVTEPYYIDESGSATDWIELYNTGTKAIDVSGMFITDAPGVEGEYQQIPTDNPTVTTIPPKGYLVLICGAADANGNDMVTQIKDGKVLIVIGLCSSTDNFVALYTPDKKEIDKSDDFNGLEDDKSFGRESDGAATWVVLATKTPGKSNDGSAPVAGTLVINEFMASNDSWSIPGEDPSATFPDWIEIYNTGETAIDMGGWYVTDDLDDPAKYQLPKDDPSSTTVPGHGYLIIICDGIGEGIHTDFKLSGGGESVGISENGTEIKEGYTYCNTGCDLGAPPTDDSMGRDGDGNAAWIVFKKDSSRPPTPGSSNN